MKRLPGLGRRSAISIVRVQKNERYKGKRIRSDQRTAGAACDGSSVLVEDPARRLVDHVGQHALGGGVHHRVVAGEVFVPGRITPTAVQVKDSLVRLPAIEPQVATPRVGMTVVL